MPVVRTRKPRGGSSLRAGHGRIPFSFFVLVPSFSPLFPILPPFFPYSHSLSFFILLPPFTPLTFLFPFYFSSFLLPILFFFLASSSFFYYFLLLFYFHSRFFSVVLSFSSHSPSFSLFHSFSFIFTRHSFPSLYLSLSLSLPHCSFFFSFFATSPLFILVYFHPRCSIPRRSRATDGTYTLSFCQRMIFSLNSSCSFWDHLLASVVSSG